MSALKRSRAQLLDQDTGSPNPTPPLAGVKKRKLNTDISAPTPGSRIGSLKSVVGSFLGYGKKGKENTTQGEEEVELNSEDEEDELMQGQEDDVWEVPISSPETSPKVTKRRNASEARRTISPIKKTPQSLKSSAKSNKAKPADKGDIWEVPEEEETPRRTGRKGAASSERAKALLKPVVVETETPTKRKPGRPKKSQILKVEKRESKKEKRDRLIAAVEEDEEHVTPRKRGRKPRQDSPDELAETEDEDISTFRKSGRKVREKSPVEEPEPAEQLPTGRKRGRPSKQFTEVLGSVANTPKGILTPSKKRLGRPKKSVIFQQDSEIDLGFTDIPVSAELKKLKSVKKTKVVEEAEVEQEADEEEEVSDVEEPEVVPEPEIEDDEVSCGVCSGLDSRKRNPIILCDGCDFAVHLDCYQIPKLPKGDWFCRTCRPEEDPLFPLLDQEDTSQEVLNNVPDIDGFEDHFRRMQRILLDRLTGQSRITLRGHDEEMQKVYQVVEQTVTAGEGNSMLVIGARGCGKTTLVESVISDLAAEHRENFHVVRLNGFIHTDDKLALKEIWRQLGKEMEVEDDQAGKSNYADTLASLLALLSHPSEISESNEGQTAKSVVFVLDEFDLFTTHARQTLLYNLFDIAQARKAPIVVLGVTTRIDVVESLEKRVKSRFSHRYVHLSLPRSLPAYWDICKEGLMVDDEAFEAADSTFNQSGHEEFLSFWKSMIADLYEKDAIFKHHLQSEFYQTKSVPAFFTSCILPIANLTPTKLPLTGRIFLTNGLSLSAPDSKLQILQGLSELELALLIAAARLDIILDTDTCNFAMAYDEYSSLISRHKIQTSSTGVNALGAGAKVWGREVALGAWERLVDYELLVPAGIGIGTAKDFGAAGRMWKVDVGLEEIPGSLDGISGVMGKWCREI